MASYKQRSFGALVIAFGVLVLVGAAFFALVLPSILRPTTNLALGDGVFRAKMALTQQARVQGLSGVDKLDSDQALLMAFPGDGKWGIWMKDMKFPIDIVWLNSEKSVVYIAQSVSPDSYPQVFMPTSPSRYVVELPAGTVSAKSITVGKRTVFQIAEKDVK